MSARAVMPWERTTHHDRRATRLADRHYSRRRIGATQVGGPARKIVLVTPDARAVWVALWPQADKPWHAWPGAWECRMFRNEAPGRYLSSELITAAVAVTRYIWGEPPAFGYVTFIDRAKTRPKADPGYCYLCAGWHVATPETTKGGLVVVQQNLAEMPPAMAPLNEFSLESVA